MIQEGIVGIDWDANPCPACGGRPRIHITKPQSMRMVDGRMCKRVMTRSYYDCQCQNCVTQWFDSTYDRRGDMVVNAKDLAREAWDAGRFL